MVSLKSSVKHVCRCADASPFIPNYPAVTPRVGVEEERGGREERRVCGREGRVEQERGRGFLKGVWEFGC